MQLNVIKLECNAMQMEWNEMGGMELKAMECNAKKHLIKRKKLMKSFLMVLFSSVRAKKRTHL